MGICLFTLIEVNAQIPKKAEKYFSGAKYDIGLNEFQSAKEKLLSAIKAYPDYEKAHLYLADVYFQLKDYEHAITEYKWIKSNQSSINRVNLFLARSYFNLENFDETIHYVDDYLKNDGLSEKSKFAGNNLRSNAIFSKSAIQNAVEFNPINLGIAINSEHDEYMPAISADEATFIYTRKVYNQEDLYISGKVKGEWTLSNPVEEDVITTGHNEGAHCISANGKVLYYTICNERNSKGSCDIYISSKSRKEWSLPTNIGGPINSIAWDSQPSLSADGKSMYFVSNRRGGYGGKDIWVSHAKDGFWQDPINLGPTVNTRLDEQTPFVHFDSETLYFSSNGHIGLGKQDIFFTRNVDGQWTEPTNLGYPINTQKNESGLTVSIEGIKGYYSADKEIGLGGMDIYEFVIPENARPKNVTYVKGKILDSKTNKLLNAAYVLTDIGVPIDISNSTSQGGEFLVCLPSGRDYSLHIKREGYLFESLNFALEDKMQKEATLLTIKLHPIEVGNSVILRNIFFNTDSYELIKQSAVELNILVELLNENPEIRLEISGHTDNTGSVDHNLNLSQSRANSVVKFLVEKGINSNRLISKGYGSSIPISDNETEEGRSQNRRTEFKVIE